MAEKNDTQLDELAERIFAQRIASGLIRGAGEQEALDSYRKAQVFLSVREKVASGALKTVAPKGPQMADCCAPNLPRTHPHNLVSQRMGDLGLVNRIRAWLDKNPTPEGDPDELLHKLHREFSQVSWDLPTVNVARAIFPAYAQ